MTTDQVTARGHDVYVRFGHELPVPEPLGDLLQTLIRDGKSHVGVGSPVRTPWLFPAGLPGRPISASRLAESSACWASPPKPVDGPHSSTSQPSSPPPSSPTC